MPSLVPSIFPLLTFFPLLFLCLFRTFLINPTHHCNSMWKFDHYRLRYKQKKLRKVRTSQFRWCEWDKRGEGAFSANPIRSIVIALMFQESSLIEFNDLYTWLAPWMFSEMRASLLALRFESWRSSPHRPWWNSASPSSVLWVLQRSLSLLVSCSKVCWLFQTGRGAMLEQPRQLLLCMR